MADVDDFVVDEAQVMAGNDRRIAPAVESAVAMGFDEEDATAAAKEAIISYPGRDDVAEIVVDALLRAAPNGGARLFPPLPAEMPARVGDRQTARAAAAVAAVDLTREDDDDDASPEERRREDKRPRLLSDADARGRAGANGTGAAGVDKGKEVVTVVIDDEDDEGDDAPIPSGNALMAELAAARMAREQRDGRRLGPHLFAAAPRSTANDRARAGIDGGGGSSGGGGLSGAAARAAALSGGNARVGGGDDDEEGAGVGSIGIVDALLSGVAPLRSPLREVRLLTYNVWFAEHVALVDRVQGLSDVVVDTDPHVVCLQEVTPNIHMLLHAMPWFEDYKATPTPPQQYFSMVLFKRSMDKADRTTREVRKAFPGSVMGRYLSGWAGLECGGGRELTVGSSHLESFISKEQTSSDERVRQMRDSLRTLDAVVDRRAAEGGAQGAGAGTRCRNVLFMGDTNWDERTDGDVPLPERWADAWLTHGDGSPGYTYDMKKNPMMSGYLQKRLDRVLYKLEDFDVSGIRMVGTSPVTRKDGSAVTHVNEFRGRRETKPVLPSDHFGLLVTLEPKGVGE